MASVGDFRLFRRERELEVVTEEGAKFLLHLLGETVWPGNADKPVVGVPHVFDADEGWVINHDRRGASDLPYQFPKRLGACSSFLDEACFLSGKFAILRIDLFLFAPLFQAQTYFLHFFVQFVQVDIG